MASGGFMARLVSALRSTTFTELAVFFVIVIFARWLLIIIYRLTFHPLARYPGNFLDKISDWPHVIRCYRGNRHVYQYELHKKYGSVIRTGPNWLDFNTVTAQNAIHRDRSTNTKKGEWYKTEPAYSGDFSVQTVIDKQEHDFRRRVLNPAFSESALREHEQFIDLHVRNFLDKVGGKGAEKEADGWSVAKDFSVWITYFGFDFIGDLAFGSSFDLLGEETHRYLPNMVMNTSKFLYYAGYLPIAPLVRKLLSSPLMQYMPDSDAVDGIKFFEASGRRMEERKKLQDEEKTHRKDLFHYIFSSRDPETGLGFTQAQLVADSGLLLAAGSDGVAATLSGTMFYLLRNPDTLEKLRSEVRGSFATFDDVRAPKINRLAYLNGVINESLRMSPGVPSSFPRDVLAGGLDVDGLHLPEGVTVGVSPYPVHHNEAYFPDSFAFRPERWFESEDGRNDFSLQKRALCTFGAGRFDCVGKNIAILASKLLLAKMVWAYDFRAAGGVLVGGGKPGLGRGREREDEFQLTDWLIGYRTGPMVQWKVREVKA